MAFDIHLVSWAAPGDIRRVSLANYDMEGDDVSVFPSISADGRFILFVSDASNLVSGDTHGVSDIFLKTIIMEVYLPMVVHSTP